MQPILVHGSDRSETNGSNTNLGVGNNHTLMYAYDDVSNWYYTELNGRTIRCKELGNRRAAWGEGVVAAAPGGRVHGAPK
jgi:hypothetical protein